MGGGGGGGAGKEAEDGQDWEQEDRTARGGLREWGEEETGGDPEERREGRKKGEEDHGGEKRQGGVTPGSPCSQRQSLRGSIRGQSDLSHPALRQQQDAPLCHALSESSRVGGPC